MSETPIVSVILPVYNAELYIKESIDSILNQTFTNFELIIINDGSTDNSEKIILSYLDLRIKYTYQSNCGLAGALNNGIKLSKGKFIARQDQDDISYPNRLQKQVDFLEVHSNIILLGARAKIFTNNSTDFLIHKHAILPAVLKFDLLFDNPFVHSTIIFRKKDLDVIGLYNTDRAYFEDYELWSRFAEKGDVANLKDVLLDYRHHDKGLSKSASYFKEDAVFNQSLKNIELLMGKKEPVYIELAALIHWKEDKCKGLPKAQLFAGLETISKKIIFLYPTERKIILNRLNQYKKVILYRLNIMKRKKVKQNPLKLFFLKVENKILKLHPHVINN